MVRASTTGRRLSRKADYVNHTVPESSAPDLNIAARGILNGQKLAPADLPRRPPPFVLRLAPGLPVRPPRTRMLLGSFKPGRELPRGRFASPVLIAVAGWRVHHPGNMA